MRIKGFRRGNRKEDKQRKVKRIRIDKKRRTNYNLIIKKQESDDE